MISNIFNIQPGRPFPFFRSPLIAITLLSALSLPSQSAIAAPHEMGHPMTHSENMEGMAHEMNMQHPMAPADCDENSFWDYSTGMCSPLAEDGKREWMVHGNTFLTQGFESGLRGRNQFAVPNMVMGDIGTSLNEKHYLNANLMLTAEKWTLPRRGYPELFQIGEEDKNGRPYIDAQHPHSSPIMGFTVSDTIRLGEKKHLKIFFAPRGQATEGPTAFMHRVTGMANPDAPLGHHLGQDVSHITSTVIGGSLGLSSTTLEASTFHGTEPEPDKVDLPIGSPNSFAGRIIQELGDHYAAMASAAYVKRPEEHDPDLDHIWRASASVYANHSLGAEWMIHHALIYGIVTDYDHISSLQSVLGEFLLHSKEKPMNFWGRLEFVQRAASELAITSFEPRKAKWLTALTMGYTHDLAKFSGLELKGGFSGTQYWAPEAFRPAYGGNPKAAHVFLQLMGMKMGSF